MSRPQFTVVLTTYNRPTLLRRAVASVVAQTVDDWELLIIDDAGPIPAHVDSNDSRIRVIRRLDNGGLAASRNSGIENAQGENIAFLDDDDLYMPDRLEMAQAATDRAPVTICWNRYFFETSSGNDRLLSGNVHDRILDAITPPVGATTVHRDQILRFNESYQASQDVEWWIRLSAEVDVETVPQIGYLVRRHQGVRHKNTRAARTEASLRMLTVDHPAYFARHPRAAALRWKRVGLQALSDSDYSLARNALIQSIRLSKDPRDIAHLGRTVWHQVRR